MRIQIDFDSSGGPSLYRWALILFPILLVIAAFWLWAGPILETLSPFALAFVFAYLVNPIIDWMAGENRDRFRMHRAVAILLLFLFLFLILAGILGYIVPQLVREGAQFTKKLQTEIIPYLKEQTESQRQWLLRLPIFDPQFWSVWYQENKDLFSFSALSQVVTYGYRGAGMVAEGAGGVWAFLSSTLGGAVSVVIYLSLLLVIMFYMLLDFTAFKRSLVGLLPEEYRERFTSVMSDIDRSLGGFIRGQATVCLCVGLMVTAFMFILGVPFAILIGLAAGLFNFIPYLGPAMGVAPAIILTVIQSFEPETTESSLLLRLALVVGSFGIVQMADGFLISPKALSSNVDVPPLVVMGALMLGGAIAGVTGMVLAIPVYCILRVLVGEYRKEWGALQDDGSGNEP